ncbi:hypothetical protein diail_1125 [Diaporthe ilicicola]|nr:hypothetical protein diail_1125 [Diaporthe ilicicola]
MAGFKNLPGEIRTAIWAACLSNADMQGIYIFKPEDFAIEDQREDENEDEDEDEDEDGVWEAEREVTVAFPVIMHVCRESREYAKSHLSFNEDTFTGASVPCRPYRPETDVFFVPHRHFDDFQAALMKGQDDEYNGKLPEGKKSFGREIVHLALTSRIFMTDDRDTLAYFIVEMTALRNLYFVFGNTDALDWSRPLALRDLTYDKEELVPGKPRTRIHVEDTLDQLMEETAFWEVPDEATAPWDGWTGAWLFEMHGKKLQRGRGLA